MNWAKGFSASYYMMLVDNNTWRDVGRIDITGGSIKREAEGLMQSADVDCVNYPNDTVEKWVRIYLDARQAGDSVHIPLFTGLATSPEDNYHGLRRDNAVQCYSVLKPAEDIYLQRGWYAPIGAIGSDVIKRLLSVIHAPVKIQGISRVLDNSIIAEDKETCLSMAQKILLAINWRLRIDGDGTVTVMPYDLTPVEKYDPLDNAVIETEIEVSQDRFECPNVFMAINNDMMAIARDDDPDSDLSTISRNREVWMREDHCNLADNETIAQYAKRRLKEVQKIAITGEYDRRFIPDIMPQDVVNIHYPEQGLNGLFMVDSQSIDIGYGARTSESVIGV